jgi:hypothetical protein
LQHGFELEIVRLQEVRNQILAVDETDHVVSRISWRYLEGSGGNPVLKADKGGDVTQEWLKFRDEVWLPAYGESRSTLRFFFGKRILILRREEYSEYKKFVSETTIKVIEQGDR